MNFSILSILSGAEGWGVKSLWLRRYRPFEYGIPRHDTIARVSEAVSNGKTAKTFF